MSMRCFPIQQLQTVTKSQDFSMGAEGKWGTGAKLPVSGGLGVGPQKMKVFAGFY